MLVIAIICRIFCIKSIWNFKVSFLSFCDVRCSEDQLAYLLAFLKLSNCVGLVTFSSKFMEDLEFILLNLALNCMFFLISFRTGSKHLTFFAHVKLFG